jgi:hypothetical protein
MPILSKALLTELKKVEQNLLAFSCILKRGAIRRKYSYTVISGNWVIIRADPQLTLLVKSPFYLQQHKRY